MFRKWEKGTDLNVKRVQELAHKGQTLMSKEYKNLHIRDTPKRARSWSKGTLLNGQKLGPKGVSLTNKKWRLHCNV